jgi:mannose-6-phosphate isomerase-like protein (cupin superfamily)
MGRPEEGADGRQNGSSHQPRDYGRIVRSWRSILSSPASASARPSESMERHPPRSCSDSHWLAASAWHDFEESFIILEGEIEATFRGVKSVADAGETVHIPANAPHQFHNKSDRSARLLCICSPAGQEEFFAQVGVAVATRTTAPPKLDKTAQAEFKAKAEALAPKYQTELLQHA